MKIIDEIVICVQSLNDANTWFVFRENGVEVRIELVAGKFRTNKELKEIEIEYLNKNLR